LGNFQELKFVDKGLSGVYKIYFDKNDSEYIGSSKDLKFRIKTHLYNLRSRTLENERFQNLFDKLGEDCLNFEIIELCEKNLLIEREYYHINNIKNSNLNIRRKENEWVENSNQCQYCQMYSLNNKIRNKIVRYCRLAAKNYNIEDNFENVKYLRPNLLIEFAGMCEVCMFDELCESNYPYVKKCNNCGLLYIDIKNNNVCSFCKNTEDGLNNRRLEYEEYLRSLEWRKKNTVTMDEFKEIIPYWYYFIED
jgi:hypothetical protein